MCNVLHVLSVKIRKGVNFSKVQNPWSVLMLIFGPWYRVSLTQFKSKQEWRFTFTDRLLLIFTSLSLIVLALRLVSKFKAVYFGCDLWQSYSFQVKFWSRMSVLCVKRMFFHNWKSRCLRFRIWRASIIKVTFRFAAETRFVSRAAFTQQQEVFFFCTWPDISSLLY